MMKLILLVLFLTSYSASAQEWIKECIDYTINTNFSKAESLVTARMDNADSSLQVYFYYASVLNSKMTHFENHDDEKAFYDALDYVTKTGRQMLKLQTSERKKAEILFYIGSAYGYLGFYQGQIGEWFSAVRNGSKAQDFLLQAVDADSTIWDAYLGLGTFKYWLSTKINWLPFVADEREEGIALINKTINHKPFSRFMAMHQLVYILLDYGDFEQAEKIANVLIEKYPQSQFMYWAYSHVYMKKRDYPKAIAAYQKLLELIEADQNANPNHRITCLARLADMYARSSDCQQANKVRLQIEQDDYFISHEKNDEVNELLLRISESCGS